MLGTAAVVVPKSNHGKSPSFPGTTLLPWKFVRLPGHGVGVAYPCPGMTVRWEGEIGDGICGRRKRKNKGKDVEPEQPPGHARTSHDKNLLLK